ncbi:MAG: hypothetical protein U5L98_18265 [Halomonas sp.]|uniref:hypothetical protein n=1 Tax=Halomonas sp. TaxID=1486246 RepID=UPI002ACE193B|nr:hypothetical protein [Halomonas sp.]MDZ7854519.1 hypothetical protein [Halomonas sp.]
MKNILAAGAVAILSTAAHAEMVYQGTVTLQDGTTYNALRIGNTGTSDITNDDEFIELHLFDGSDTFIEKNKIASFEFLSFKHGDRADEVLVTLKNGNTARLRHLWIGEDIKVYVEDQFTEETRWIRFDPTRGDQSIARIAFTSMGPMMWSDSSQKYFPTSYSYDPYTGEKLTASGDN